MQYFCQQFDDDVTLKRREALVIVCIGIFICFIFLCANFYLYETSRLEFKAWDVDTVTAADFTVETPISPGMWTKFIEQHKGSLKPDETLINKFHDFYKNEIEKIV